MTALTADRVTPKRAGTDRSVLLAANAKIFVGAIVVLNAARFAQPAGVGAGLLAVGRSTSFVDNTGGADGALRAHVDAGTFLLNSAAGADLIGQADIGNLCYLVDDNTVAKTNGGGARSVAGVIFDIDPATGAPWVAIGVLHP